MKISRIDLATFSNSAHEKNYLTQKKNLKSLNYHTNLKNASKKPYTTPQGSN
jgi:hypothetical protein